MLQTKKGFRCRQIFGQNITVFTVSFSLYWTESSGSLSAGEMTANQSTIAEASGSIRPETPENERRNKIDGK